MRWQLLHEVEPFPIHNDEEYNQQHSRSLSASGTYTQELLERHTVSSLHKDSSWSSKLTDQALTRYHSGDDTTTGYTLHYVVAVPSHQMPIVDDISLAFLKLTGSQSRYSFILPCKESYVFPDDSSETRYPQ